MHNTICNSLVKNFIPEGTQKIERYERRELERERERDWEWERCKGSSR